MTFLGPTVKKTAKENHVSPLHICAAVGGPKIAKMLIDYDELLMRMRNSEQMIPLHKAAQYGRASVTKILVERYKTCMLWHKYKPQIWSTAMFTVLQSYLGPIRELNLVPKQKS